MDGNLVINEIQPTTEVDLDWSKFSWGDLLAFTEAQETASPQELQAIIAGLVSKLIGKDATQLPAMVAMPLIEFVTKRLTGNAPEAAAGPNA